MFHGPFRLRFDGGWYVAVICIGSESDDGGCDCEASEGDFYNCEETDDPGYCHYLAGIPGLGVFTEGGDCDCGASEDETSSSGCDKCSGTFEACEIGCTESGCGCCYKDPPPPGADGVGCSKRFMLVGYETLQQEYPEILTSKECQNGEQEENTVFGDLIEDLASKGIARNSITVAAFRKPLCRVEIWGECEECPPGDVPCTLGDCDSKCYDAESLDLDVFDEWQANEIGAEWKEGECPGACLEPCPPLPPLPDSIDEDIVDENTGNEIFYDYSIKFESPPLENFQWEVDPSDPVFEYAWLKEEIRFVIFDGNTGSETSTKCVEYFLIGCDRLNKTVSDVTSSAVTGLPSTVSLPACDGENQIVVPDGLKYAGFSSSGLDENTGEFTCEDGLECEYPKGTGDFQVPEMGAWVEENFPFDFPEINREFNPLP